MSLTFTNDAQKVAYDRMERWLSDMYPGEVRQMRSDEPGFEIRTGSVRVVVMARGSDTGSADLSVYAFPILEPDLTGDLLDELMDINAGLLCGGFTIDGDGDLCLSYTLVADELDYAELDFAVTTIVEASDKFDDSIRARFGGQRWQDREE